jgi:hypothetical protein
MKNRGALVACAFVFFVACVGSDPSTESPDGVDGGTPTSEAGGSSGDTGGGSDSSTPGIDATPDADAAVPLEGKIAWAATYATSSPADGVAVDSSGNIYVVGNLGSASATFGSETFTNADGGDAYIVKLNPAGVLQWAKQLKSDGVDIAHSVAVDSAGDVYVSGAFHGTSMDVAGKTAAHAANSVANGYIAKLSGANGAGIWNIPIQASGSLAAKAYCTAIAIRNAADLAFNCYFRYALTYGGTTDSFNDEEATVVGVLDASDGTLKWSQILRAATGSTSRVIGDSIDIDSSSNVYVGGYSYSSAIYLRTNVAIGNSTKQNTSSDGFVLKLAAGTGAVSWVRMLGSSSGGKNTQVAGIRLDPSNGSVYVAGGFDVTDFGKGKITSTGGGTNNDAFVVRLGSSGDTTWQKTFGGDGGDIARAIAVDGAGNVVVGGAVDSAGIMIDGKSFPAGKGFYVTKLDPTTAVAAWVTGRTNGSAVFTKGVAAAPSGHSYATGQFIGAIDFDKTVTAQSSADAFVVALTP